MTHRPNGRFFVANTGVVADALAYPATQPCQIKNTPFQGYFYFWWGNACTNRAENKQEFTDLMQRVKEFKEKWLN